jgi:DNA polymerase IV
VILHADLDSFYASVEQRDDPALRGRPVAVGGGVVLAASYEAKAFGVRSAMGGRQARALCPRLVTVPPRFDAYVEASRAVFAIFRDTTPLVEGLSIDEAFLDVGGLGAVSGPPVVIAVRLRERVRSDVGLAITVGVAGTKFLAKVASGLAKPDGLLVVPVGGELAFLHPLPVERLWGVGARTAAKLHDRGVFTVGEVAGLGPAALTSMLGRASGRHLHALAHNRDPRVVVVGHRRRSIGGQRSLGGRRAFDRTDAELDEALVGLVDRVTGRLRKADRVARTVTVRLRFADFTAITRAHSLARPTQDTAPLLAAARTLLAGERSAIRTRGITLVGVSLGGLDDADAVQLELPFPAREFARLRERGTLDPVVDELRVRFGRGAVQRATLLGRSGGTELPMLPD